MFLQYDRERLQRVVLRGSASANPLANQQKQKDAILPCFECLMEMHRVKEDRLVGDRVVKKNCELAISEVGTGHDLI